MVTINVRRTILSQIMKTNKEAVKLKRDHELLCQVYQETAFDSLSDDERKFYDLVVSGKIESSILLKQREHIYTWGLFPGIYNTVNYNGYYASHSEDNIKARNELGITKEDTDLYTKVAHNLFPEVYEILYPLFTIKFEGLVPILFDTATINWKSINYLKARCPKKVFTKFIEATKEYVRSMSNVATILQEVNSLLQRDEVTLGYLRKNFQELSKLYEDGKEK